MFVCSISQLFLHLKISFFHENIKLCVVIQLSCPFALSLYMYMKMAEYGKFEVGGEDITDELFLLFDNEIMENLDLSNLEAISDKSEISEMCEELEKPALTCLPKPETPAQAAEPKRFRSFTENELQEFQDSRQSCSTKKNTKWGIKLFQEWHTEVYNEPLEFETAPSDVLAIHLRKFYCEAKPKESPSRKEKLLPVQADHYHKNTLKNLRSALNRHLQDLRRNVDIVRDKEFKSANHTLDGMIKVMTKTGALRATQHKTVIT